MTYTPKLHHAIITALLSVLFAYAWAFTDGNAAKALLLGVGIFLVITAAIMAALLEGSHYYSVTAYIEALVKMDADLRNALAFSVPSLRLIATRGKVQTLFADTRATKEHIHLFLQDSTQAMTASKRDWHTTDRPRWAWEEIYSYLRARKMVGEYAVGPESYPWIGTAYHSMALYFLTQTIENLGSPMVYASDEDEVKLED